MSATKKVIKIDDSIRYGKYDGMSWMDLPNDYLLWLQKTCLKIMLICHMLRVQLLFKKLTYN